MVERHSQNVSSARVALLGVVRSTSRRAGNGWESLPAGRNALLEGWVALLQG